MASSFVRFWKEAAVSEIEEGILSPQPGWLENLFFLSSTRCKMVLFEHRADDDNVHGFILQAAEGVKPRDEKNVRFTCRALITGTSICKAYGWLSSTGVIDAEDTSQPSGGSIRHDRDYHQLSRFAAVTSAPSKSMGWMTREV